jgi:peptidoglycan-associated lipoprotein
LNIKQTGSVATLVTALAFVAGCASDKPAVTATTTPANAVAPSTSNIAKPSTVSTTPAQTATNAGPAIGTAVYFDYDKFDVKNQYANIVRGNADKLASSNVAIELDGNADERGSREYNMALGQKRADAVKKAMTALGVKADRIETISFGEDKPKATGHDEAAWAENRRVDIVSKSK